MSDKEMRELDKWIHANVMEGDKYVGLMKRGYWYRPNAKGYTDRQSEAGRYTREEAKKHEYPHDEPVTIQEFDAPYYTTDRAASQEVLEKCFEVVGIIDMHRVKCAPFNFCVGATYKTGCEAEAETLALAICLFAKKVFSK